MGSCLLPQTQPLFTRLLEPRALDGRRFQDGRSPTLPERQGRKTTLNPSDLSFENGHVNRGGHCRFSWLARRGDRGLCRITTGIRTSDCRNFISLRRSKGTRSIQVCATSLSVCGLGHGTTLGSISRTMLEQQRLPNLSPID